MSEFPSPVLKKFKLVCSRGWVALLVIRQPRTKQGDPPSHICCIFLFRFKKAPNRDTLPYPDSSSLHVLYTLCTFGGIQSLCIFKGHGSYLLWPVEVVLKVSFHPDIWATLVWIQRAIFTKWQFSRIECDLISIFRIACYISCMRVPHPTKRHHAEMDENYGPHYLVIFVQIYFQAAGHICPAQIIQTLKIITICNSTSKPFWGYFQMR